MSEYMLAPGARLEIGPGGKPYESLGACCASCAKSSLGEVATEAALQRAGQQTNSPSSTVGPMLPYLAVAGAGLIGLVVYLRRRKRR